jgi:hypothetical protein
MAFAQYSKASGAQWARDLAVKIFANIERRKAQPYHGRVHDVVP